jgi:hypothetical protein
LPSRSAPLHSHVSMQWLAHCPHQSHHSDDPALPMVADGPRMANSEYPLSPAYLTPVVHSSVCSALLCAVSSHRLSHPCLRTSSGSRSAPWSVGLACAFDCCVTVPGLL